MSTIARDDQELDVKEVVHEIDGAASLLGHAEESFGDLCVIFEAIQVATEPGSLPNRLAKMAEALCIDRSSAFCSYKEAMQRNYERYQVSLGEVA
ncbi:hypothetical protein AX768_03695 [Burkholderia sp. PAMC 28687]|uniref:hypothetical protein n=1 Tax=Burkholderia sp. PAMC 28687 TaxID=1795874 RepID=UPI0007842193|nr:hypothetical protein [Burkholderia sp. PAMC 28687]AMM13347.1 hypothetical protein AX768_03695 [Burkholderia sp. PAMC 28687]